ncbi:putative transposase for insertion sequence element [Rhodococcus wratislaviensis IFP 2016]|nr:putative transposase for insertion sequence element [Rhodococcus wratislaviensis IFP 2016]
MAGNSRVISYVDITTRTPIDLLGDRTAETVATWLKEHPGTEIVCHDRAGAYADGIRSGAPDAVQVADRWHLWLGPGRSCGKDGNPTPRRSPPVLDETEADEVDEGPDQVTIGSGEFTWAEARRVVIRTRERHSAIKELASAGMSISVIGRKLSLKPENGTEVRPRHGRRGVAGQRALPDKPARRIQTLSARMAVRPIT